MLQRRADGERWGKKARPVLPGYGRGAHFVPTIVMRSEAGMLQRERRCQGLIRRCVATVLRGESSLKEGH